MIDLAYLAIGFAGGLWAGWRLWRVTYIR